MSATQPRFRMDQSDDELTAPLRRGESAAAELAELYARHHAAVRAYAASCCRDPHTADDLTSEAFTRTIDAVRRGGGPYGLWRPYLLSAVRRMAIDWAAAGRRAQPSDELEDQVDHALTGEELTLTREEGALVVRSFQRLPERWRAVLWYTAVQGEPVSVVAGRLGISESGVSSLAERAREGLREAYLSVHALSRDSGEACSRYSGSLAALVRRKGRRPGKDLGRHLENCAHCRRALTDLVDLNSRLRVVLPGSVLIGGGLLAAGKAGAAKVALAGLATASGAATPGAAVTATSSGHIIGVTKSAAAVGATMSLAVGGYFLILPYEQPLPPPPDARPTVSASPSASAPPVRDGERQLPVGPHTTLRTTAGRLCLEPVSQAGSAVRGSDCDGNSAQSWSELQFQGPAVLLRNTSTGLCLRDTGAGSVSATQVPCDTDDSRQVWRLQFSLEQQSMVMVGGGTTLLA